MFTGSLLLSVSCKKRNREVISYMSRIVKTLVKKFHSTIRGLFNRDQRRRYKKSKQCPSFLSPSSLTTLVLSNSLSISFVGEGVGVISWPLGAVTVQLGCSLGAKESTL